KDLKSTGRKPLGVRIPRPPPSAFSFQTNVDANRTRNLSLLRRPAIRLGARTAHQHCPFTVTQAIGLAKGRDGLFVIDDRKGAGPVRAPQAALETPGVEHASERVPDVREGIRLPGQRAGAADLDHR